MNAQERKESVRKLWRTCFGDSEAYMDLYFGRKYTDASNICREEEGQVVSALQCFRYPFRWGGSAMRQAAYLSGIATLPAWRGRGLAAALIREAHRQLYDEGVLFCALIPAEASLFEYYRRLGYSTCIYRRTVSVELPTATDVGGRVVEVKAATDELYRCFRRRWGSPGHCVWELTREDFDIVVEEWRLSGGHVFAVFTHLGLSGVVFLEIKGDTGRFYEMAGLRSRTFAIMAAYLRRTWPEVTTWQHVMSGAAADATPFAQVRVIRVAEALRRYAALHPSVEASLYVADSDLPSNDGYYELRGGRCYRRARTAAPVRYTPSRLTAFLLRDSRPNLGFMLE